MNNSNSSKFPTIESLCQKHNKYSATSLLAAGEEVLRAELREVNLSEKFVVKSVDERFCLLSTEFDEPIANQALLPMVYYIRTSLA